ncbi:protein kinase domain-containing protein [Baekduia sp. Peel2402]|uniref:protein kinase domain-containing protein n=1 Tax=Baekduia sp. Peel2402 TaxID=3458296 RepID=UPI00403E7484
MSLLKRSKVELNGRTYADVEYVARGGSGEVYKASFGDQTVAIKAFFPFYERRQLEMLDVGSTQMPNLVNASLEFQRREYEFLARISHPNIVRVHDAGSLNLSAAEKKGISKELLLDGIDAVPLLITEFVDGLPLDEAITEFGLTSAEIAYALARVAEALDHLHGRHEYLHTDVKPANVLVRADIREPVLIDFALSKNLNFQQVDAEQGTKLLGDWDLFPELPDAHPLKQARKAGASREELRSLAYPGLDLYQFGVMLDELGPLLETVFEDRERRYLKVLHYELTRWDRVRLWSPGELAERVHRLSPIESTPFGVPELAAPGIPERTLVIPGDIAVPLTRKVEPVVRAASFRRLAMVNQLSLLDIVYPGATYKRQVHVLYTYELTRQLVAHLYASPRFRYFFDEASVQQLLVVALLHDINHFPFLHTFQESKIPELRDLELFDLLCDGRLTGEAKAGEPSLYDLLADQGIEPARFKRLVYGRFEDQPDPVDQIISSILNSGVDVDKLSYLRLDAFFTGVPYGGAIDIPTLLKAATVAPVDERFHLAFGSRALAALEHAVFTRYWNFRAIYWHHTNRAIMAMVLAVVRDLYMSRPGIQEYLRQTVLRDDYHAVRFLDEEFERVEQEPSILHGLERDRSVVYKRLYTLHPTTDPADRDLYRGLKELTLDQERSFRGRLATMLEEALAGRPVARDVGVNDVLVDIPRRDLDLGGSVYIETDGKVEALTALSKPVEFLSNNYTELSQRARIFVAPWLRAALRDTGLMSSREAVRGIVSEALRSSGGPDEVR